MNTICGTATGIRTQIITAYGVEYKIWTYIFAQSESVIFFISVAFLGKPYLSHHTNWLFKIDQNFSLN